MPGGAHEALLAAGRIADLNFDRNENTVAGWRTVRFSDNYLDLRDGELAEITVRRLTGDVGDDQLRAISGLTR